MFAFLLRVQNVCNGSVRSGDLIVLQRIVKRKEHFSNFQILALYGTPVGCSKI